MNAHELPKDITDKVAELFSKDSDRHEIMQMITEIYDQDWGIGKDQLTRALLILSGGKPDQFKDRAKNMEPRDLIMEAESMLGNPGHYFLIPFY